MSWLSRNKGAILPAAGLLLGGPTGMAAGAALAGGLDANANRRKSEAALQPLVNDLQNTYSNPATPALTAQRNNMLANAARLYRNTVGANNAALAGRGMTDSSVAQGAQYRADKALAEGLATTNEAYLQTLEQRRQNAMDRLMSILNGNEAQARADEGEALGTLGTLANEWARRDRLKKIKNSSTINPNVSRAANAYAAQFGQRAELDAPTRTEYRADPMLPAETIAGQPDVVMPTPTPGTLVTNAPSPMAVAAANSTRAKRDYVVLPTGDGGVEILQNEPLAEEIQAQLQPMSISSGSISPASLTQSVNGNLGIAANLLLGRPPSPMVEPRAAGVRSVEIVWKDNEPFDLLSDGTMRPLPRNKPVVLTEATSELVRALRERGYQVEVESAFMQ